MKQKKKNNLKSEFRDCTYIIITADDTFPVQSRALQTEKYTVVVCSVYSDWQTETWPHLSARRPELPLEELQLHLDPDSCDRETTDTSESTAEEVFISHI